jgi:hypothetical protein
VEGRLKMQSGNLGFAAEDVDLIYWRLDQREPRLAASASVTRVH